jgi:hypothetical protein
MASLHHGLPAQQRPDVAAGFAVTGDLVFGTGIPRNVRLRSASHGKPVLLYDIPPRAVSYLSLARQLLAGWRSRRRRAGPRCRRPARRPLAAREEVAARGLGRG